VIVFACTFHRYVHGIEVGPQVCSPPIRLDLDTLLGKFDRDGGRDIWGGACRRSGCLRWQCLTLIIGYQERCVILQHIFLQALLLSFFPIHQIFCCKYIIRLVQSACTSPTFFVLFHEQLLAS
jgi:hypothetical protein